MNPILSSPGSNAERSRAYNRGLVLGHIRHRGEAGRAEIARASGLSTQAVSNIIADLLTEGWVSEAGRRSGQRGQPAVTYAIRGDTRAALGIEIRPDAVLAAWIDLDGRELHTERVAVQRADPATVLPIVANLHCAARHEAVDEVIGAGVVMPGPMGQTGLAGLASELPEWGGIDAAATLSEAVDMPVTLENDANAAAMAERVMGVAQDLSTFCCLYFGAGLGLGVISDGRLFRGAFGNAGEIGHIPVPSSEGLKRLEDVASRMALQRALLSSGCAADTVEEIARRRASGHAGYCSWLSAAAAALSHAVVVLENLTDPESIVLAGAMPAEVLDDLVSLTVLPDRSVSHRPGRAKPRLVAGRSGRMTATLGAAALVVNAALSPSLIAHA